MSRIVQFIMTIVVMFMVVSPTAYAEPRQFDGFDNMTIDWCRTTGASEDRVCQPHEFVVNGATVTFQAEPGQLLDVHMRLWPLGFEPGTHILTYRVDSFEEKVIDPGLFKDGYLRVETLEVTIKRI